LHFWQQAIHCVFPITAVPVQYLLTKNSSNLTLLYLREA
jgi:hypothetical protein